MKKISIIKNLALFVISIVVTTIWLSCPGSLAESANVSLTLSPMSQKIILTPGESYEGAIKVANGSNSTKTIKYETSVGSFAPTREDGKDDYSGVDVATRSNYNIMMDWITVDGTTKTLGPNTTDVVTYKIQVPENAPAGAQYASILITDVSPSEVESGKSGANIESKMQIASIIYANVAGETIEKGSITENSMPSMLTSNKLEAISMVRNEGNVYTSATYTFQVWPLFSDEEICTNEENADSTIVLPNTERYHIQSCDLPMVGIFKAKQAVKIFGEESVLEKTILVCPLWLLFIIILAVVAIVIWIIIRIRVRKKSQDE